MLENLIYFDFNFNNNINNYVSIIIQGGLGNQLFQIGTVYAYSIKNKKKLIFKYSNKLYNSYNLERKSFWNTLFSNKLNVLNINEFDNIKFLKYNEKKNYCYNEIPNDNNNILLFGYFQSFKYLENEKSTRNFLRHLVYSSENLMYETYELYNKIKRYFTNINNKECEDDDIVSMHFRRTDYILTPNNYHNSLDINYYINALKIVNRNNIVIFSDDIEWCKKNINNKVLDNEKVNIYFIDINNVEVEFILMSFIKHNIIANSTFSLMASYISYYESKKIIVAPKEWLSEIQIKSYNKEIEDIYHNDVTNII
jgi:hypothetical protein|tara:strand:+ start:859 stop:1791 length:933 start_codon:yes stop_codon:yes gene_type:complete